MQINVIRDRLMEAQVKLAELVALLDDLEQTINNGNATKMKKGNIFSAEGTRQEKKELVLTDRKSVV